MLLEWPEARGGLDRLYSATACDRSRAAMKRRLGLPELVVSNVRLLGHLRLPSDMKLTSSEKVRAEGALAGIAAQDLNESSGACKPLKAPPAAKRPLSCNAKAPQYGSRGRRADAPRRRSSSRCSRVVHTWRRTPRDCRGRSDPACTRPIRLAHAERARRRPLRRDTPRASGPRGGRHA
eukprot:scaffold32107_cov101-Phaeocystis_antarctica.AAC.2